jgi:RhoGAP domain
MHDILESVFPTIISRCFQGRLVNIQNYSVNTIASVLKKFLRKIPGGIFGPENEASLFREVTHTHNLCRRAANYGSGMISFQMLDPTDLLSTSFQYIVLRKRTIFI